MLNTYDVISTREFIAPATEVWRAWSDPVYVTQWWGPYGFTSPTANLDFRVGGTSLVCMRAPAESGGQDMYNTWTYRRIEPISLIEFDNAFTDAMGARIDPPPGVPLDVRHVVTFAPLPYTVHSAILGGLHHCGVDHASDFASTASRSRTA